MTTLPAHEMRLDQLIAETGDPSSSMASGGLETIRTILKDGGLPYNGKHLETGCASGWQPLTIAGQRPDATVIGVDPQADSIAVARTRAEERGLKNAFFMPGDARQLPFTSGTFDLVFGGNIPVFVPPADRSQMVRECRRVVRPGGRIVFVPIHYPGSTPPVALLDEVERLIGAEIHRSDDSYWKDLYAAEGLVLVDAVERRFETHTDAELRRYVEWVMAGPQNSRHKPERRAELGDALLDAHVLFRDNNELARYTIFTYEVNDWNVHKNYPLT